MSHTSLTASSDTASRAGWGRRWCRRASAGQFGRLLAVACLWVATADLAATDPFAPGLLTATAAVAFLPPAYELGVGRWCRSRGRYDLDALPVINEGAPNARRPIDSLAAGDVVRLPPGATCPGDGAVARVIPWDGDGESATVGATVRRGDAFADVIEVRLDAVAADASPTLRPYLAPLALSRPLAAAAVVSVLVTAIVVATSESAVTAVLCGGLPWAGVTVARVSKHVTAARLCRAGLIGSPGAVTHRPRYVALDKAGTLTDYDAQLATVHHAPEGPIAERDLLEAVATVEQGSDHPIAAAVLAHARDRGVSPATPMSAVDVRTGFGVSAETAHGEVCIGNRELMRERGVDLAPLRDRVADSESRGHSVSLVAVDGTLAGAFAIKYTFRPGVGELASAVRRAGRSFVLVTGDAERSTDAVADACGFTRVHAPVLGADEKRAVIEAYESDAGPGTMIGDGPNDWEAIAAARVGVAFADAHHAAVAAADRLTCASTLAPLAVPIRLADRHHYVDGSLVIIGLGTVALAAVDPAPGVALVAYAAVLSLAIAAVAWSNGRGSR